MLNSFLSCPHRELDKIKEVHQDLQKEDPLFYAHLAAWYNKNGEIRDHKEMFSAMLINDPYLDNREVGLALFREEPPYMKARILGTIKGRVIKVRNKLSETFKSRGKVINKVKIDKKVVGLIKNVPNSLKTEVTQYLRWLESDNARFDEVCIRSYNNLKTLYASLKIKPSERADQVLFKGVYPEESKLSVFKKISDAKTSEEAAKLIVENKIPYMVAVGLIKKMTPTLTVAIIDSMSPQELINNMASLEERGVLNNKDIKSLVEGKLDKASKSKKVSALKSKTATKTGRIKDADIVKKMDNVADKQVQSYRIQQSTLIGVDCSGSMDAAIECGKGVAALVSGAISAPLYVTVFNAMAKQIPLPEKATLSDAERAFAPIRAGGYTCMGSIMYLALRNKWLVEQVVIITDEGETDGVQPLFVPAYHKYCQEMGVTPNVVVVRVGRWQHITFTSRLKAAGIAYDTYEPRGDDYYALPGLLPMLSRASKTDLLYEVMDTKLPKRKQFKSR